MIQSRDSSQFYLHLVWAIDIPLRERIFPKQYIVIFGLPRKLVSSIMLTFIWRATKKHAIDLRSRLHIFIYFCRLQLSELVT